MMTDVDPRSGSYLHPDYEPANVRPSRWRHVVTAVLAFAIALVIVAGIASAADWQMVVAEPGKEPIVRHIYFDGGQIACATDSQGVAIVLPKGSRIRCERAWKTNEARVK